MSNFHVGQKVVCVDDDAHADWPSNQGYSGGLEVVRGHIYVVRWAGPYTKTNGAEIVGVRLEGIGPRARRDTPFSANRFRPVASKPTSMDIIRSIVLDPSRNIPADPREPAFVRENA